MELAIVVALIALTAFIAGWKTNEWFNWQELTDFCKTYVEGIKR